MGPYTYETIGAGYGHHRRADPRLVQQAIHLLALPRGSMVVDVGAGTGNYAMACVTHGYRVIGVDPSRVMLHQAASTSQVQWIAGVAEALPLAAGAGDGILCMLAIHHVRSVPAALREMRRVVPAGPLAIFTFDPRLSEPWWFDAYFPTLWQDAFRAFPPIDELIRQVQASAGYSVDVVPFALPPDLVDRFGAAGWHRPEIYLDPAVRASMSCFALGDQGAVESGVVRLARDLEGGIWRRQHADLLQRQSFDAGYRFIIAR